MTVANQYIYTVLRQDKRQHGIRLHISIWMADSFKQRNGRKIVGRADKVTGSNNYNSFFNLSWSKCTTMHDFCLS